MWDAAKEPESSRQALHSNPWQAMKVPSWALELLTCVLADEPAVRGMPTWKLSGKRWLPLMGLPMASRAAAPTATSHLGRTSAKSMPSSGKGPASSAGTSMILYHTHVV